MQTDRYQRYLPLAGLLFSLLLVAGLALSGSQPSETASAQKVFSYWSNHKDAQLLGASLLIPLASLLLVFFGAGLRAALRSGEGGESTYSSVAFGGAVIAATGLAFSGAVAAATANAADQGSVATVYTLHQLSSFDWVPWLAGFSTMLIAAGVGGLRSVALPRPLSWTAIAIAVALFTPVGFFAFPLLLIWVAAVSVVLYRGQRATDGVTAARAGGVA
jgi:hypothetical protein